MNDPEFFHDCDLSRQPFQFGPHINNGRPAFTPSTLPAGCHVVATCQAPGCGGHRYPSRALMLEKAGDVPLDRIEPRLRCVARPQSNKRGPACGGRMTLALSGPIARPPEANADYPKLPGLPRP